MRELLGHHAAAPELLQPIVADRRGCAEGLLEIARIEFHRAGGGPP